MIETPKPLIYQQSCIVGDTGKPWVVNKITIMKHAYGIKYQNLKGKDMITITKSAENQIKKSIEKRGYGLGLRLGVKTAGCSGLAYKIEYVDYQESDDIIFESNEVKIFIDPKSLAYLDGMTLDYTKEGLNEGFKFNNPNVKDECGCGESFRV